MKIKLDKKTIAALALPDSKTEEIYWCDQLDRFGLRLRRSGGRVLRSFVVQYRRAGATRRMTIGPADVLTPEQSRLAARKLLAKVELGEDPQGARSERRARDRVSFAAIVAEYIKVKSDDVRPASMRHLARYLTSAEYFGALHRMPLDQVARKDVAGQLVRIARENGNPSAFQARAKLSAFFSWAMKMGLVDSNPVIGTAQPRLDPPRDRVLSDAEMAAIWTAADGGDDYSRIVRLLILMPCRRQEVGGMCWSEIDIDAAAWTIPAERAKNARRLTLPLTASAMRIIKSVLHQVGRDNLFGARQARGFNSWGRGKRGLDRKLAISAWRVHDLRRTIATRLADLGTPPHVIEQILNHQSGHKAGVAGIYNRSTYEREVRQALALWEDHIMHLVEGGERKVLSFPINIT